jgi:hypothetical protein
LVCDVDLVILPLKSAIDVFLSDNQSITKTDPHLIWCIRRMVNLQNKLAALILVANNFQVAQ